MVQARSNSARRGWVFGILGVAAVAAGVSTVWNQLPSISAIGGSLVDAHPGWSLAALGAQALAVLSFAEIQRRLVTDLGGDLSRANSVELTLASGAISMAMPAGSAFGAAYTYRRLRRTGLRPAGIGVAMVASAGLLTGTLILLYAVLAGPTLLDGLAEIVGRDHVGSLVVLVGAVILLAILKLRRAADRPPVRKRSGRISGYVRTLT
ncbi:MAG TPA: lysylphosphatidylglycerol synthase domain-containing protein [Nakamurella sp.]